MPFLLLLCLMLACMPVRWPDPAFGGPADAALATAAAVLLLTAAAAAAAGWVVRGAADEAGRDRLLRAYQRFRQWHLFAVLGTFAACLYGLGWGAAVQDFARVEGDPVAGGAPPTWAGSELLVLAPLVAALVLAWVCYYDAERELNRVLNPLGGPFPSRAAYVGLHARQSLALVAAPVLLFVGSRGLARAVPGLAASPWFQAVMLVPLAGMLVVMPWVLRGLFGLRRLPDGPQRDRLFAAARRLDCRLSDILLWDTRQSVANAMVVGVVPQLRYVLLTDRLLAQLTPEEVEAVFGHEAGHVRHRHVLTYLLFLFLSVATLYGLLTALEVGLRSADGTREWLEDWEENRASWLVLPPVLILGTYVFVVFGLLSRWCERQADVFGCRAVSCGRGPACPGHADDPPLAPGGRGLCPTGIRTFASALNRVADLNGLSRSKPGWLHSWQHSTIARRVEFLEGLIADPSAEPRFQARAGWLKWGLLTALAVTLAAVGQWCGWERLLRAL